MKNAVIGQDIVRIRVHQVPRLKNMKWGEVGGFPRNKPSEHRLTLIREVLSENEGNEKYGTIENKWDRWDHVFEREKKWIGATVILKEQEV